MLEKLLFLCPMLFIAGIIDGISGGGGLIALPSYIISGLPISSAYACNKMQSCLGTSASLFRYAKSGMLDVRSAVPAGVAAILGSFIATKIMLTLDDATKKIIIAVAMCFVIALTLISSRIKVDTYTLRRLSFSPRQIITSLLIGFTLGMYDGFFGPGGGTIALLLFGVIMKYDLRVGGGNGKMIVVISNLTSMILYILEGSIIYAIAIPCSAVNIAGSYIGASLATKKGAGFVKYVSFGVVCALAIYAITEIV